MNGAMARALTQMWTLAIAMAVVEQAKPKVQRILDG
jgi:hypothetical protein